MVKALCICARTPARRLLLLAALFGFYFGGLWIGAIHYPHPYDWRRNVISNLLSPRDNPGWHWAASAGVAMAGLCMLPLAAWIENALGDDGSKLSRRVRRPAFLVGIVFLIGSAVVAPGHMRTVLGTRHPHEALARLSAAGFGMGMLCACRGVPGETGRRRTLRKVWRVVTVPPVLGGVGSAVVLGLAQLHWMPQAAAYLRTTVFWHLSFWEWVGSGVVFLFFAAGVGLLGGEEDGAQG